MKLSPNTNPPEPDDLLIRFHNQTGAAVDITGRNESSMYCRWYCHGCGQCSHDGDYVKYTRRQANDHAAACRASHHRLG
ncbi:hypothetical protein [Streptomyces roseolus]